MLLNVGPIPWVMEEQFLPMYKRRIISVLDGTYGSLAMAIITIWALFGRGPSKPHLMTHDFSTFSSAFNSTRRCVPPIITTHVIPL